ncbi:MAG: L,D-transpeptidase [Verrucomicrobiota bacterium]
MTPLSAISPDSSQGPSSPLRRLLLAGGGLLVALAFTGCGCSDKDGTHKMIVSVRDQRLLLVRDGKPVKSYKISTSKFGIGDRTGSYCTPLGRMEVSRKIGDNAPAGAVFKRRRFTGEVIPPDAPGRDPIVSRILWLRGTEAANRHAFARCIYIHGTPEERCLGTPASYGCIRMGGRDVIDLYDRVGLGADVFVVNTSIASAQAADSAQAAAAAQAAAQATAATSSTSDQAGASAKPRSPASGLVLTNRRS